MGFFVGGCYYSSDHKCTAYPFESYPSSGKYNNLPDYYQECENERKNKRRMKEEQEEQQRQEEFKNFFNRFFGQNDQEFRYDDSHKESLDRDYPYNIFGLKRSASDDDMKQAYRKAVLKTHPDHGGTSESFIKVREAWEYFSKI